MLLALSIQNLAVVEDLEVAFDSGMSVITGETGAGKSVLLNSLNLALGARADKSMVRSGCTRADISATFAVDGNKRLQALLEEQALEADDECILRRVIGADGRSKAFINGASMPLAVLSSVGEHLVDMHGQNEHQLLLKPVEQLNLLDGYANNHALLTQLNELARDHRALALEIETIQTNQSALLQQQELYQHQLDELEAAALNADELNSIEAEYKTSSNAKSLVLEVSNTLNQLEAETGANAQLSHLSYALSKTQELDPKLSEASELLTSAQVQTQEAVYELNNYLNHLNVDEEHMQNLEARISELHELSRKHNCQLEELLEVQAGIAQKLADTAGASSSIVEMRQRLDEMAQQYQTLALRLTQTRREQAQQLSKQVSEVMQVLGMPGSEFSVALVDKAPGVVHLGGAEQAEFLVRTNMGQTPKALKKIASGGELSRISLAISVVGSDSEYTPTIVFDEVDVGISGAVAEVVGQKLKSLSEHYQVLCITHLAQVASFGDQHLKVHKTQSAEGASTTLDKLSAEQRVQEVARILSGASISDKALHAAQEMISASN